MELLEYKNKFTLLLTNFTPLQIYFTRFQKQAANWHDFQLATALCALILIIINAQLLKYKLESNRFNSFWFDDIMYSVLVRDYSKVKIYPDKIEDFRVLEVSRLK